MADKATGDDQRAQTERLENVGRAQLTRASLLVLEGAEPGKRLDVIGARFVLGSGETTDHALGGRGVSKRHAQIELVQGQYLLTDLESTNGTYVNGSRIREIFLSPGDLIVIGTNKLRFEPRQEELQIPPSTSDRFGEMHAVSVPMRQVFGILERVAPTDSTLLIQGESGTGKDLVARAVHAASPRARHPCVVFDCSAVSPELIASELFGHREGAFTGASRNRQGAFEAATGGTIFLDEIGELPMDMQPKLLRALEAREIRPVGANHPVPVNVRVIAATHRDLVQMVKDGKFRQDLYYRLAVVSVHLPPLRHRREDIAGLARAMLAILSGGHAEGLSEDCLEVLEAQSWPGNVRELRNVLERSLALAGGARLEARNLIIAPALGGETADSPPGIALGTLEEIEKEAIRRMLATTHGQLGETAQRLGIHRETLRRKIRQYGLKGDDGGPGAEGGA